MSTIAVEIVVLTVIVNFFMTLRGRGNVLRVDMAARWFFVGIAVAERSGDDGVRTWSDLWRTQDVKKGGVDFVDPRPSVGGQPNPNFGKVVLTDRDKVANMACGYVIALSTEAKELKETRKAKDLPPDQRKYFTKKNWICLARPGTGGNSVELVAKRRAEVYLVAPPDEDDDEPIASSGIAAAGQASAGVPANGTANASSGGTPQPSAPPVPPAPPSAPTPPVAADWPPPAPWVVGGTSVEHAWLTPGYVWRPGLRQALPEADYRAGKRE